MSPMELLNQLVKEEQKLKMPVDKRAKEEIQYGKEPSAPKPPSKAKRPIPRGHEIEIDTRRLGIIFETCGVSPREFANAAGISYQHFRNILSGACYRVRSETLSRICTTAGIADQPRLILPGMTDRELGQRFKSFTLPQTPRLY